jgi:hypothetical protein
MRAVVFWVVTPCGVVVGYRRFGGPCGLHHTVAKCISKEMHPRT